MNLTESVRCLLTNYVGGTEIMSDYPFDYNSYMNLLHDDDYIELYDYYSKETMMGILGVARQENPHSSFLRWLLDMNGEHGYGSIPMRKFLSMICLMNDVVYAGKACEKCTKEKNNLFSKDNIDLLNEIKFGRYEIINLAIANEVVLQNQRRADILAIMQLKFSRLNKDDDIRNIVLLVENKIHSSERDKQTESYVKDLSMAATLKNVADRLKINWAKKYRTVNLFVYLNPFTIAEIESDMNDVRSKKNSVAKSADFITVNYQYLLDGVIEPLSNMTRDDITKLRMMDYIRCLGQAKITSIENQTVNDKNNDGNYLIMAISKSEREMALSLWRKHKKVILPVLESLLIDKYDGFILNEGDRDFWYSLANLYRTMDKSDFEDDVTAFKELLVSSKNVPPKFEFNGQEYESRKKLNIGRLARDIICDFIKNEISNGKEPFEVVKEFRNTIQQQSWINNWLREVILLDIEVDEIHRDYNSFLARFSTGHHTESWDDFKHAFFEKNAIDLGNGNSAYVAKYWSAYGIDELIKWLDSKYSTSYTTKVKRVS